MTPTDALPVLGLFQAWVSKSADEGGVSSISVSLLVGGQWVSGHLTSYQSFVEAQARHLRANNPNQSEFVEGLAKGMVEAAEAMRERTGPRTSDLPLAEDSALYLIDADPGYSGARCPLEIRVDAVDAFFIGAPEDVGF